MENPQNEELIIMVEKANAPPKELNLFDQGDMNFKKECWISYIKAILQGFVKDFDSFTIRKDWKGIIWGTGNQAQLTKCHRIKSHF